MNDSTSGMIVQEEFGKQRNDDVKKDISTDVASTNGSKTMVCFCSKMIWIRIKCNKIFILKYFLHLIYVKN